MTEPAEEPSPSLPELPLSEPPLVLLPGMLADVNVWDDVAAALIGRVPVRTARIDLDDSVVAMAQTVLADAPPLFALAGHSLGAIVACEVARQAPDRITRLALINASGRPPSEAQLAAWSEWAARVAAGEFHAVAKELSLSTVPTQRRRDRDLVARNEAMAHAVGPAGFAGQLRAQAGRPSSLGRMSSLAVPVLVVTGALDEVCPPELQIELAAQFTDSEHVILDDVGHLAPIENAPALAAQLLRWLSRERRGCDAAPV